MTNFPLPLVLASGNADKAAEIVEVMVERSGEPLAALAMTFGDETFGFLLDKVDRIAETALHAASLERRPDVDEIGTTFEANARIKAAALTSALGVLAIADDSGLAVDALGGAPGVWSARYAGPEGRAVDNIEKLLREMGDAEVRDAHFVTVAVARWPDGQEVVARGSVDGHITHSPRGDGGFGYDPVFEPLDGDGRTFAEMSPSEKHAISHRGRAFRALADELERAGKAR